MESVTASSQKRRPTKTPTKRGIDYSKFSHQTHITAQKLSCDSCHKFPTKNWKDVRKGDEAFEDVAEYPEHETCLQCHRKQFFARERPAPRICINCHVKASPVDTSRYPFPSLGEKFLTSAKAVDFVSDFRVAFPHDKHLDVIAKLRELQPNSPAQRFRFTRASFELSITAADESDPKSCSTCHVTHQPQGSSDEFVTKPPSDIGDSFWLKKGTFKTRPISHAVCFTCHNVESELPPLPKDCNACHKLSITTSVPDFDPQLSRKMGITDQLALTLWRVRQSAGTFRHEAHDMSCTKCHNAATMNTIEVKSLKVPVKSCSGEDGCHVTKTVDDGGILNYEMEQRKANAKFVCVKCHIAFGSKAVPASHTEAITKSQ
jgi:hypothetical protein